MISSPGFNQKTASNTSANPRTQGGEEAKKQEQVPNPFHFGPTQDIQNSSTNKNPIEDPGKPGYFESITKSQSLSDDTKKQLLEDFGIELGAEEPETHLIKLLQDLSTKFTKICEKADFKSLMLQEKNAQQKSMRSLNELIIDVSGSLENTYTSFPKAAGFFCLGLITTKSSDVEIKAAITSTNQEFVKGFETGIKAGLTFAEAKLLKADIAAGLDPLVAKELSTYSPVGKIDHDIRVKALVRYGTTKYSTAGLTPENLQQIPYLTSLHLDVFEKKMDANANGTGNSPQGILAELAGFNEVQAYGIQAGLTRHDVETLSKQSYGDVIPTLEGQQEPSINDHDLIWRIDMVKNKQLTIADLAHFGPRLTELQKDAIIASINTEQNWHTILVETNEEKLTVNGLSKDEMLTLAKYTNENLKAVIADRQLLSSDKMKPLAGLSEDQLKAVLAARQGIFNDKMQILAKFNEAQLQVLKKGECHIFEIEILGKDIPSEVFNILTKILTENRASYTATKLQKMVLDSNGKCFLTVVQVEAMQYLKQTQGMDSLAAFLKVVQFKQAWHAEAILADIGENYIKEKSKIYTADPEKLKEEMEKVIELKKDSVDNATDAGIGEKYIQKISNQFKDAPEQFIQKLEKIITDKKGSVDKATAAGIGEDYIEQLSDLYTNDPEQFIQKMEKIIADKKGSVDKATAAGIGEVYIEEQSDFYINVPEQFIQKLEKIIADKKGSVDKATAAGIGKVYIEQLSNLFVNAPEELIKRMNDIINSYLEDSVGARLQLFLYINLAKRAEPGQWLEFSDVIWDAELIGMFEEYIRKENNTESIKWQDLNETELFLKINGFVRLHSSNQDEASISEENQNINPIANPKEEEARLKRPEVQRYDTKGTGNKSNTPTTIEQQVAERLDDNPQIKIDLEALNNIPGSARLAVLDSVIDYHALVSADTNKIYGKVVSEKILKQRLIELQKISISSFLAFNHGANETYFTKSVGLIISHLNFLRDEGAILNILKGNVHTVDDIIKLLANLKFDENQFNLLLTMLKAGCDYNEAVLAIQTISYVGDYNKEVLAIRTVSDIKEIPSGHLIPLLDAYSASVVALTELQKSTTDNIEYKIFKLNNKVIDQTAMIIIATAFKDAYTTLGYFSTSIKGLITDSVNTITKSTSKSGASEYASNIAQKIENEVSKLKAYTKVQTDIIAYGLDKNARVKAETIIKQSPECSLETGKILINILKYYAAYKIHAEDLRECGTWTRKHQLALESIVANDDLKMTKETFDDAIKTVSACLDAAALDLLIKESKPKPIMDNAKGSSSGSTISDSVRNPVNNNNFQQVPQILPTAKPQGHLRTQSLSTPSLLGLRDTIENFTTPSINQNSTKSTKQEVKSMYFHSTDKDTQSASVGRPRSKSDGADYTPQQYIAYMRKTNNRISNNVDQLYQLPMMILTEMVEVERQISTQLAGLDEIKTEHRAIVKDMLIYFNSKGLLSPEILSSNEDNSKIALIPGKLALSQLKASDFTCFNDSHFTEVHALIIVPLVGSGMEVGAAIDLLRTINFNESQAKGLLHGLRQGLSYDLAIKVLTTETAALPDNIALMNAFIGIKNNIQRHNTAIEPKKAEDLALGTIPAIVHGLNNGLTYAVILKLIGTKIFDNIDYIELINVFISMRNILQKNTAIEKPEEAENLARHTIQVILNGLKNKQTNTDNAEILKKMNGMIPDKNAFIEQVRACFKQQ